MVVATTIAVAPTELSPHVHIAIHISSPHCVFMRMFVCIETIPNSTTSPILIIKLEWLQRILHNGKDFEIRGWQLRDWPCRIWL